MQDITITHTNMKVKHKSLTRQNMWWWAAERSGWWSPQTSSSPPQTWWSRRWRSQWCSPTPRSPWLLVSASQRGVGSSWVWEEKCRLNRCLRRSVVVNLKVEKLAPDSDKKNVIFTLAARCGLCSSASLDIWWSDLTASLLCLTVFVSLVYSTYWTSPSAPQTSERKMWKYPSLFVLPSSPQIPISHASSLSPSLAHSSCVLLKTDTIIQGLESISHLSISISVQTHFWHPRSGFLTLHGCLV